MKNTLLALTFVFTAAFSAQAQDSTEIAVSDFKPVAGNQTLEVGFNLQYGVFLNGGQVKYRKFTTDKNAFRLGIGANFDLDNPTEDVKSTYGAIQISPGLERHFTGTSRLSPYIGAELPVSYAFSQYEDQIRKINGAWGDTGGGPRGFWSAGLNALAGVDFYIVKNFYVGLEFGAGIAYRNYNDVEINYKESDYSDRKIEGGSSISFDTFANGGFRIGFVF